jgi:ribonuclease J
MRVIPLGGCGEFGRNLTCYALDEDLVAVDCGAQLAGADTPGIELLLPDLTWLKTVRGRLRGYVLTHAHDDHLRALPYALKTCPAPVFGLPLTLKMAARRCQAALVEVELHSLERGVPVRLGAIEVEPIAAAHSIPDACALALTGGGRRVVHTGDLKLDSEASIATDLARLRALGDAGVDLLVSDSTNAPLPGRAGTEAGVHRAVEAAIAAIAHGRVAVTLFSSHLDRVGAVIAACARLGRKVVIVGRGLRDSVDAALAVGVLRVPAGVVIDEKAAARAPRDELALLVTGSQGEAGSALDRLASGDHPALALEAGDSVLFSSRPVPGNELKVERIKDALVDRGVRVIDDRGLHASGHACADELTELLEVVRPRALLPVHGRPRQLAAHARLAEALGIPAVSGRDGDVIELGPLGASVVERVPVGWMAVEGDTVGEVGPVTLRARSRLARAGVVVAARVGGRIRIESYGVCDDPRAQGLAAEAEQAADRALAAAHDPQSASGAVERAVARAFEAARGVRPTVLVVL